MAAQTYPLPARFSRWLLACAVRHWPEETRPWGEALAAEVDETTDALETLLWSWGGIMLFARSVMGSFVAWLKLPAGSSASGGPVDPSNLPKRSRLLTAVVLIAAAALFLSPEGREATRTIRGSWSGFWDQPPSDRRALEKLADRAEKDNDAVALAFVALSIDDPARAATSADRAVLLNPELIWIYGARQPMNKVPRWSAAREERLERLRAADPGNAVPVILAAESVAVQSGAFFPEHLSPSEVEAMLASNPKWMALMTRALASPRYDSYEQRRVQLTSSVWNRERYLPPTVASRVLWSGGNSQGGLGIFSRIRVHEAEQAVAAGNWKEAERLLGELDSFGERIGNNQNSTVWDKFTGLWVAHDANIELEKLYTSAGRTAEAQSARLRVQQLGESQARLVDHLRAESVPEHAFRRAGILVQGFGLLTLLAGIAALAGILLLELWPARLGSRKTMWRRTLCWAADYAPAAVLVSSGALLLSFLPIARAFSEFRTSASALHSRELFGEAFNGIDVSQSYFWWRADAIFWIWCFATVTLAMFAVFIVVRSFHRARLKPITT